MRLWRALRRVPVSGWAWVHFKVVLGIIYPILAVFNNTGGISEYLAHPMLLAWLGCIFFGAVVSIIGIFMSWQPGRIGVVGVSVELLGIVFLFLGPLMLAATYTLTGRPNSAVLCWAIGAAIIARGIPVARQFFLEATDQTKEV